MSTISLLVFVACTYFTRVSSQNDYPIFGTGKIGAPCERDYNCIQHSFCRAQMTCLCEPFYAPSPDFGMCIATVGLFCDRDEVCSSMTNAQCRQGVCACKETFTVDLTNSSNCLPSPSQENDRCQRNDQCIDAMDRALCINERCQCLTDHHFAQETGKCVRSRGIFATCTGNYQCYMPHDPELLECNAGTCKCRPGKSGTHCSGAVVSSLSVAAFLLLLTIKIIA